MRTILLRVVVFLFFAVCALGARAQSVDCNNPTSVAPDGRTLSGNIPAMTTFWFSVAARGTSSYAAEANYPTAADNAFPDVDAFAAADVQPGCSGTSSLSPRNIRLFDPTLPNGNRVSVTAASAMTILVGVTNSTMQARDFTVRVAETTLFNPLWSTFGGFETFYRLQNTTRDSLNVTLRLINDAGTTVATHNQMLAANSTAPTIFTGPGPAPGLGVADNQAGQAILTHDGPPGALQVDGFLGSFAGTSVVLPIKIVAAREGVSVSRLQPTGGGGGGGSISIGAGPGIIATPDPITGTGTIAVNTTVIQARVMGTCPPGSSIRSIDEPGMVDCETDDGADVAGTGVATTAARSDHTHDVAPLGAGNTGVGVNALAVNVGANNTAMGSGALDVNTNGVANTAVGSNALGSNQTGVSNTAVGRNALVLNTGSSNTAVGADAMADNTTGIQNTAVGDGALNSNQGGANNTAVGRSALALNTTGGENVAVGNAALLANSTGNNNIAIGVGALQQNNSSGNTAVGDAALTGNSSGSNNTAVGISALNINNASGNTAVGAFALDANTSGTGNTAVGLNALGANTTANSNTAVGASALVVNTGSSNTALGASTLLANTSGFSNTALGTSALSANTTSGNNTAVGFNSMASSTAGNNTAVGSTAMFGNTTGVNNTALGTFALNANMTADNNTAVGFSALTNNIAAGITAVGASALDANTTGTANTALGSNALGANVTGTDNTAVGINALFSSTGNGNIGIGSAAGIALTTGSQNIYIGNGGGSGGESSTIRIGTAQTATFIAGITFATVDVGTGTAVFSDAAGKLGSVVSTRRAKEDIRDMGEASAGLLRLRPVVFRYRQPAGDGSKPIQYGLIAEEVAEAMPELVIYGQDGQPQTVKYHELPALLLNELQRQQNEVAELRALLAQQSAELAELKAALRTTLAQR